MPSVKSLGKPSSSTIALQPGVGARAAIHPAQQSKQALTYQQSKTAISQPNAQSLSSRSAAKARPGTASRSMTAKSSGNGPILTPSAGIVVITHPSRSQPSTNSNAVGSSAITISSGTRSTLPASGIKANHEINVERTSNSSVPSLVRATGRRPSAVNKSSIKIKNPKNPSDSAIEYSKALDPIPITGTSHTAGAGPNSTMETKLSGIDRHVKGLLTSVISRPSLKTLAATPVVTQTTNLIMPLIKGGLGGSIQNSIKDVLKAKRKDLLENAAPQILPSDAASSTVGGISQPSMDSSQAIQDVKQQPMPENPRTPNPHAEEETVKEPQPPIVSQPAEISSDIKPGDTCKSSGLIAEGQLSDAPQLQPSSINVTATTASSSQIPQIIAHVSTSSPITVSDSVQAQRLDVDASVIYQPRPVPEARDWIILPSQATNLITVAWWTSVLGWRESEYYRVSCYWSADEEFTQYTPENTVLFIAKEWMDPLHGADKIRELAFLTRHHVKVSSLFKDVDENGDWLKAQLDGHFCYGQDLSGESNYRWIVYHPPERKLFQYRLVTSINQRVLENMMLGQPCITDPYELSKVSADDIGRRAQAVLGDLLHSFEEPGDAKISEDILAMSTMMLQGIQTLLKQLELDSAGGTPAGAEDGDTSGQGSDGAQRKQPLMSGLRSLKTLGYL